MGILLCLVLIVATSLFLDRKQRGNAFASSMGVPRILLGWGIVLLVFLASGVLLCLLLLRNPSSLARLFYVTLFIGLGIMVTGWVFYEVMNNYYQRPVNRSLFLPCENKRCFDGTPIQERYRVTRIWNLTFSSSVLFMDRVVRLQQLLYTKGPVGVIIRVRQSFFSLGFHGSLGRVYDPQHLGGPWADGKHIMCILGWIRNAWIVRNSWGTCWNDNGYVLWKMGSDAIEDRCFMVEAEVTTTEDSQ